MARSARARADPPEAAGRPPGGLLVVCALGIERLALRSGAAGPLMVLRTGMGPRAAAGAVAAALDRAAAHPPAAVLATGFCAALGTGLRPGDVVVDDRSDAVGSLAAALARRLPPQVAVHRGRIAESDHVVRGAERATLRATGAIAVDMESSAVLRAAGAAGPRPVAVARVVVDTPEYELLRAATLRTGVAAFRVLRSVPPAFRDWHRSTELPWR